VEGEPGRLEAGRMGGVDAELAGLEEERAAAEREKVERFYAYREVAATEKLAAVRTRRTPRPGG